MSYSKIGFCENQEECPKRHPVGVCLHWRRGYCDKEEASCFYRHPDDEFGVMKNDGSRTPDMKRKRTLSGQNIASSPKSSENHFLYQKVLDITRQLEAKNEIRQPRQEPVSRQNLPDRPENFLCQNQFQRTTAPDQFTRQAIPGYFATPVTDFAQLSPVQPVPVPGWTMGNVMPQWGTQGVYPGNQM